MGYFDGLTDAIFKKDAQARDVFYPYGILGSGYILNSEEQKNKIRKFIKVMYMIMFPGVYIGTIFIGAWFVLAFLPIYYIWYYFKIKKMMSGLTKSDEKLKTSEAYKNSARSHSLWMLVVLELMSIGFVLMGVFILVSRGSPVIGGLSIVFFGFCSAAIGYMIMSKI